MANSRPLIVILASLSCLPRSLAWYRELPSCLDEFQPFVQVGCFDNGEPGGQEALSMKTELSVTGMTVETCVAECKGMCFFSSDPSSLQKPALKLNLSRKRL